MRMISKPSTANCNLGHYICYLLSEPLSANCSRLGKVMSITHDSVNRFLGRENYNSGDLLNEVKGKINLVGGILSVDDTVIDKPYSQLRNVIGYFWSGKHKRAVKGVNLITLYYTDVTGFSVPVSFRIVDKAEGKTKNDYFQEMLIEVKSAGIRAAYVTGDSWYSSVDNLKFIREAGFGFLFGIANNRKISLERGRQQQVQTLDIPPQGLVGYLPQFGYVTVFQQKFKEESRYYIVCLPESAEGKSEPTFNSVSRKDFENLHNTHWGIEQFHRVLKQVCNIECFQVRTEQSIRNHFFCALCAYLQLALFKASNQISNLYEIQQSLFLEVISQFIHKHAHTLPFVSAHSAYAVNA